MKLESLHLVHFRNYEEQTIHFGKGLNILHGANAQGKTNVVEAIHLLATGKSHRTRNVADLVKQGKSLFQVEAIVRHPDRDMRISMNYGKQKGKSLHINEVQKNRWSELLGLLHVLLFSPETLEVVKGGPSERRRFLDILLCQLDHRYLRALQQYTGIMRQKATALRNKQEFGRYREMMPVWNESMATHGAVVARIRQQTTNKLQEFANRELHVISAGKEELLLSLQTFTGREQMDSEEDMKALLFEKLQRAARREEETGQCLAGIHRDEMNIMINGVPARTFASQGQQRSIALAFILSSMHLYEEVAGEMPLLLLDDVMSELDPERQSYLLTVLEKTQTLITTADAQHWREKSWKESSFFLVENGSVKEESE